MKKGIYSIKDKKSGMYSDPYYSVNDLIAKRVFRSTVNSENVINEYPDDFIMIKLGEIDLTTGKIDVADDKKGKHLFAVEAMEVMEVENAQE